MTEPSLGDRVRVVTPAGEVFGRLQGRKGDRVWVDGQALDGVVAVEDARYVDANGHLANKVFGDDNLCADCYRPVAQTASKTYREPCQDCGAANAFRDPLAKGTSVLRCTPCHVKATGYSPSSRHIESALRVNDSRTLRKREECAAHKYGQCTGNVKPRGSAGGAQLCDAHKGGYRS